MATSLIETQPSAAAASAPAGGLSSGIRLPAAPTGVDAIHSGFNTVYTWDYGVRRQDLNRLYEKSKESMWNATTEFDWTTSVDPQSDLVPNEFLAIYGTPLWERLDMKRELPRLRQLSTAYMLSNFLHGEQGALLATAQIVDAVPDHDAKLYAATQVMDEARHVESYARYLREKVEITFPVSPHLRSLLDTIISESRWDMKYLGMQILVEGLALAAFGFIHQSVREPLLKSIVHMVMQDEARHVAFGVMSLKGLYDNMPESELRDREDLIVEGSRLMRDRFLMEEVWECMGMPVKECVAATLESQSMWLFRVLLFSKIVPNVKRLGLLTPRVRKGFDELRVLHFETWDASA